MDLDLKKYWRILLAYRWPITIVTLIAAASALLATYVLPEKYEGVSVILVRPSNDLKLRQETSGQKEVLDFPVSQQAPIDAASKTYIEVIKTRTVTAEIVTSLGLHTRVRPTEEQYWKELLQIAKDEIKDAIDYLRALSKYGRVEELDPVVKAAEKIEENLEMEPTKDTYVFQIKYLASNAIDAAAVANAAADIFITQMAESSERDGRKGREFLERRLAVVSEELAAARQKVERFKESHHTFSIRDEHSSKLGTIASLEGDFETGQARLAGLRREYADDHPRVASLLAEQHKRVDSIQRLKAELAKLPGEDKELADLELTVRVAEDKFELMSKSFEDARTKETNLASEVRILSRAEAPTYPIKPIKWKFMLGGAGLGLVAALLLAFIQEFQDIRIRSVGDVGEQIGLPVLATIPNDK